MDVALQVRQHLPRDAQPTIGFVDEYCCYYQQLFQDVRNYEYFKYLHLGIVAPIPRKSLPAIAKEIGIRSAQSLHHFITNSPWFVEELRTRRLALTREVLRENYITVIIDETGNKKKGKTTDYVSRQYLESIGQIDRGIVSINAYGLYKNITFPLCFKVFKPKDKLKTGDCYKTKTELATEIITELIAFGFRIERVLADSLHGESSKFIETLTQYNLTFIIVISRNHLVWLSSGDKIRVKQWFRLSIIVSDKTQEPVYIREIIYGKKSKTTYWELTKHPEIIPNHSTCLIMTNLQENIQEKLEDFYKNRTWIKYGSQQVKQELGWADYRFTHFSDIERWWEIIFSVYLMISLQTSVFFSLYSLRFPKDQEKILLANVSQHCDRADSWKPTLNKLRLLIKARLFQ